MKKIKSLDLVIVAFLSTASAAVVFASVSVPLVQMIAGSLLILVLPGFAFSVAVFPRRLLAFHERLLLTLGSSIMITALFGIFLNFLGFHLQARIWALPLCTLTLVGCAVAGIRRRGGQDPQSGAIFPRIKVWQGLVVFLAGVIAVGAVGLASSSISNPVNIEGYAILWIQPDKNASPGFLRLGVINDQFTTTNYRLQLSVDGKLMQSWPNIPMDPGMKWETSVQLPGNLPLNSPVMAFLYRSDNPNVIYRQVKLFSGN